MRERERERESALPLFAYFLGESLRNIENIEFTKQDTQGCISKKIKNLNKKINLHITNLVYTAI